MNILNKYFVVTLFVISGAVFFGCNKAEKPSDTGANESGSAGADNFERTPVLHTVTPIDENFPKLPFNAGAHAQYLSDPLSFQKLPDGGIPNGPTAVVGSDVCLFYPIAAISSGNELKNLPQGEPIPFATIIPLGTKLEARDSDKGNMFEFQDNLNFFYRTTWKGKQGVVFGADLFGVGSSNMKNRINALLYKDNGHFNSFYPVTGYDEIESGILKELEQNGLAFQEVKDSEYYLSVNYPDDMISLYSLLSRQTPVFVTTDLAAHANHLVFDRTLQYLEENYFFPQLAALTNGYIKAIEQKKGGIAEEVYAAALLYFQTAQALLALAPNKAEGDDYWKTIEYHDVDAAQVLRNYPLQVIQEIEKMNNAGGIDESSVFNFPASPGLSLKEDYSQYKARGHYTKNGVLVAYFRALMWYGRINFYLGGENGEIKDYAARFAPIALFITDITESSPELKKIWQSLFDPITELIGASDDIGFYELAPLWNKIKGSGFTQWYNDPNKREAFISKEYRELRPPAISGSSLFQGPHDGGPEPEDRSAPVGWRLFGQRYTLDSEIHHHVSPPRLIIPNAPPEMQRNMVKGLDILKVFGSKTADRLLHESDYPKYPGLEAALAAMQKNLDSVKDDYWLSTYYTNILYQIRTQALFENGAGFYFTEKPGWNIKAMNSAHGTWAELRHDTILYVKQSYAEKGGGGDWEPTFRTKPLPEPIHYIEPNIPFWITSAMGIQKIYAILEKYGYLDGETAQALSMMHGLFVKAADISRLEADDTEVSRSDLNWISSFSAYLAKLVLTHAGGDGWVDDTDSLRMALAADVFTNAETGLVLETAVGIPYRLYIPLNDKQGGKRIAVGYGFSYYEFEQPMSDRLTNEEWKAIVYKDNPDMKKYLPSWMRGKVQPAK